MTDITIATISKNKREQLHVAIREWKGHTFVDLRVYVGGGDKGIVPTSKGVGIKGHLLAEVIAALQKAAGLLPPEDPRPASELARGWAEGRDG